MTCLSLVSVSLSLTASMRAFMCMCVDMRAFVYLCVTVSMRARVCVCTHVFANRLGFAACQGTLPR